MNFLAPLFLLGALAVAGPILFHLIRRTTKEKVTFSTLMFLRPTPPRVSKRSRLDNLWLLLLRCLIILLLTLGFARPFFSKQVLSDGAPLGTGQRSVLLIDSSASLRRETLWADALREAETAIKAASPADVFAVYSFDRTARPLLSFEDWKKIPYEERWTTVQQRLAAISPTWASTQLDTALIQAAELLDQPDEDKHQHRQIVLISDLTEGTRLDRLQGFAWPQDLDIVLATAKAKTTDNAGLHWVSETDDGAPTTEETPPRLRATNTAGAKKEQFQVRWAGTNSDPKALVDAYVPAGQARIIKPPAAPSGQPTSLQLTGDAADFDNTVHLLPPQPVPLPILFMGTDAEEDAQASLYYLRRAFPKTRRQAIEILPHREAGAIPAFQLQRAQLAVLGTGVSEAALASLRQFAREGHIVIVPLASAAAASDLGKLLETPAPLVTEAPVKNYALLAQIDFQHPVFTAFADPRFSDFTKIHFWKHRVLDEKTLPGARVLARFDGGDPAILQVPSGQGSLIVLTSSWRPADSQLALSSKFVPLLQSLLEQSSNLPPRKAQYFIGDEIPLPPSPHPQTLRKPDGREVPLAGGAKFTATDLPGIYSVSPLGLRFVVNLSPEESRTTLLPIERLTSLNVPLRKVGSESPEAKAGREALLQATELENRQKLWRWLVVAALIVLLLETLIAGKLSGVLRRSNPAPV